VDRKINGPSFRDISARYRNSEFAVNDLSKKVLKGGSGVWGETVMSAHPQLSEEDAGEMVRWILSLGTPEKPGKPMPLKGNYALTLPQKDKKEKPAHPGTFIFQAGYRDRGAGGRPAQEAAETIALRPAFQQAENLDSLSRGVVIYYSGKDTVVIKDLKHGSFFAVKHVDLQGLYSAAIGVCSSDYRNKFQGGMLELRLDRPDGPLLGSVKVDADNSKKRMVTREVTIPIRQPSADGRFHDLYFVVNSPGFASEPAMAVDWIRFNL
jgi:cytochrome c